MPGSPWLNILARKPRYCALCSQQELRFLSRVAHVTRSNSTDSARVHKADGDVTDEQILRQIRDARRHARSLIPGAKALTEDTIEPVGRSETQRIRRIDGKTDTKLDADVVANQSNRDQHDLEHTSHRKSVKRSSTMKQANSDKSSQKAAGLIGFRSVVEERIELARARGELRTSLRGKPLPRDVRLESNPYLSRSDVLMNRIVIKQGAAPPWIEKQQELDGELRVFRATMLDEWSRRATRALSTWSIPPSETHHVVSQFRDRDWEDKESAYHQVVIDMLNSKIRAYNCICPPVSQRLCLTVAREREKTYQVAIETIALRLDERRNSIDQGEVYGEGRLDESVWGISDWFKWLLSRAKIKLLRS